MWEAWKRMIITSRVLQSKISANCLLFCFGSTSRVKVTLRVLQSLIQLIILFCGLSILNSSHKSILSPTHSTFSRSAMSWVSGCGVKRNVRLVMLSPATLKLRL